MTRANLILAIKRESRVKNSTDLDTMISEILDDITVDYCNRSQCYELRLVDQPVTLIAGVGQYTLPVDFASIGLVRYSPQTLPNNLPYLYAWRELTPMTDVTKRTFTGGLPLNYFLSGNKINLFPYAGVLVTDSLFLDYFIKPLSIFTLDADEFPVPRLEATVKKEVIMRIDKFHADLQGAQMDSQDAKSSFGASEAVS